MSNISYENEYESEYEYEYEYDSFSLDDFIKRLRRTTYDISNNTGNTQIYEFEYNGQNVMKLPSNFSNTLFPLNGQKYANLNILMIGENCCNDCKVLSITGNICIIC